MLGITLGYLCVCKLTSRTGQNFFQCCHNPLRNLARISDCPPVNELLRAKITIRILFNRFRRCGDGRGRSAVTRQDGGRFAGKALEARV